MGNRTPDWQRELNQNAVDLAWAAGFFEGEGSISVRRRKDGERRLMYIALHLTNTDYEVIERFYRIVGVGSFRGPFQPSSPLGRKPFWTWQAGGAPAKALVTNSLFVAHLGSRRRARIGEVVELTTAQAPLPILPTKQPLTHCVHGHRYTRENTYIDPHGKFVCKICRRRHAAEWKKRNRIRPRTK